MTTNPELTPTQDLVLEVLGARARTGEQLWTFTASAPIRRAITTLSRAGLVTEMAGVVERTVRARLTDAGRAHVFDSGSYRSPLEQAADRVLAEHTPYRAAAVEFDCCEACNRASGGYVPYPCAVTRELTAVLMPRGRAAHASPPEPPAGTHTWTPLKAGTAVFVDDDLGSRGGSCYRATIVGWDRVTGRYTVRRTGADDAETLVLASKVTHDPATPA